MQQLGLAFAKSRGGARAGAGRKRGSMGHTPHRARAKHQTTHPVHVTLRASLRSFRSQQVARTILGALRDSRRETFRIAHYSIQDNHLHLIVEAEDKTALSSGVRGLTIRIAKRLNQLLFRRGAVWADRWHGHALKTPREVRNALIYVLQNRRKHAHVSAHAQSHGASGRRARAAQPMRTHSRALDPLSSAAWFSGFATALTANFRSIGPPAIANPQTWLLQVGWQRHGLIQLWESPR